MVVLNETLQGEEWINLLWADMVAEKLACKRNAKLEVRARPKGRKICELVGLKV